MLKNAKFLFPSRKKEEEKVIIVSAKNQVVQLIGIS